MKSKCKRKEVTFALGLKALVSQPINCHDILTLSAKASR